MKVSEKMTGTQMGLLMFAFIVSTILLNVPEVMAKYAKQDAWVSVFPALSTGVVSILVMTTLAKRYPNLTIIQYSSQIMGKWLGTLLGIYFTLYCLFLVASIGYEHTVFISTIILERTPTWIEIATFISLCGLAAYTGIEVIARCNQFLIPFAALLLALPFILALYDTERELLMPVFGEGYEQILKGAVLPSGWMGQFLFLGWLLPYLNQPEKARKVSFIALGAIALLLIVINLLTVSTFGPITHKLSYSFLRVIQYIGAFTPFERMESIIVALWTMGFFVKGSVLAFTFCLSVSQLLRLKDYRRLIIPITLISMIGSAWIFKTTAEWQTWIIFGYAFLAFFTHIVLPLLLLIVDSIKQAIRQR